MATWQIILGIGTAILLILLGVSMFLRGEKIGYLFFGLGIGNAALYTLVIVRNRRSRLR